MKDEIKSLHDNHTFDLVKLPKGKRALDNRWIYRVKHESNSTSSRYKARLVVKGYSPRKGVDMMTKALLRRKFEACCEIIGLAVTST